MTPLNSLLYSPLPVQEGGVNDFASSSNISYKRGSPDRDRAISQTSTSSLSLNAYNARKFRPIIFSNPESSPFSNLKIENTPAGSRSESVNTPLSARNSSGLRSSSTLPFTLEYRPNHLARSQSQMFGGVKPHPEPHSSMKFSKDQRSLSLSVCGQLLANIRSFSLSNFSGLVTPTSVPSTPLNISPIGGRNSPSITMYTQDPSDPQSFLETTQSESENDERALPLDEPTLSAPPTNELFTYPCLTPFSLFLNETLNASPVPELEEEVLKPSLTGEGKALPCRHIPDRRSLEGVGSATYIFTHNKELYGDLPLGLKLNTYSERVRNGDFAEDEQGFCPSDRPNTMASITSTDSKISYNEALKMSLFPSSDPTSSSVFTRHATPSAYKDPLNHSSGKTLIRAAQKLPKRAERELNAFGIEDNIYYTPIDANNDFLGIGIGLRVSLQKIKNLTGNKRITIYDFSSCYFEKEDKITALKLSSCSEKFFLGTSAGEIVYGDTHTKNSLRVLNKREPLNHVYSMAIQNSGIIWGGETGKLSYTDARSPSHSRVFFDAAESICKILLHEERNLAVVGTDKGKILFFDSRKKDTPYHVIDEHVAAVKGLSFINGSYLASAGGREDKTVKIWNVTNHTKVNEKKFLGQISSLIYTGTTLVVSGGFELQGTVFLHLPGAEVPFKEAPMSFDPNPEGRILDACLSPEQAKVFTLAANGKVKCYETGTPQKKSSSLISSLILPVIR